MENLIVRVHGMKSTARVIGALTLSAFAQRLEDAGRGGDTETVEAEIDSFVEDYVALGEKLVQITSLDSEEIEDLPELSHEELTHYYTQIKKHLENADYDEIDSLGEKLSAHSVPEDEKEHVERILEAISMLDYDELEEII